MRMLRGLGVTAFIVASVILCDPVSAQQAAAKPPATTTAAGPAALVVHKPMMLLDRGLADHPNAMVAWIAYVTKLALNHPQMEQERLAGLRIYAPTFAAEVAARENQVVVWDQVKAKQPGITDPYMADLEQINHAGFMREYVWEYYGQIGWKTPADLHLHKFDTWQAVNLPKLSPVRHAWLRI